MAKVSSKSKSALDALAAFEAKIETNFVVVEPEVINQLWGGGVSPGSMYAIWGPEGSGKSTLAWQIVRSFCKQGKIVWILDAEKALNDNQKESFGLTEYFSEGLARHFIINTYKDWEDILKAMNSKDFPEDQLPSLIVTDSESMVQPKIADDMSVEDNQPGVKAKQANVVLNLQKQVGYSKNIASIVLFHARANISMTGGTQPSIKQAGGFAALHIPDVRTRIEPHGKVLENPSDSKSDQIGVEVWIETEKNKFTAPRKLYKKKLIFGKGISKRIDVIDTAIEKGIIVQSGAGYYKLPSGDTVRGTQALYSLSNEVMKELQNMIR